MAEGLPDGACRELTLAEALTHVPGYAPRAAGAMLEQLPGGSVNRSYRVCTHSGRFVVRLSPHADAWLASDRSVERALHRVAAGAGIAPRIIHADAGDRWLITEFVAGRPWSGPDFASARNLARLGERLRRLHSLPAPERARFDLLGTLERYVRRIEAATSENFSRYLGEAVRAWDLSGSAGRAAAVVHHDLHGSNIIDREEHGLVLIDWECAAVSDPLLDVACILSYHEPAHAQASVLLEHAGLAGITRPQLDAAVWLFELHTLLWFRERRLRQSASGAELEAEQRLAARVARDRGGGPGP